MAKNNDQIIGLVMSIVGLILILLEFFLLIIDPAVGDALDFFPKAQYWALAIPVFLGVLGVLGIVVWIGITMYKTPPPEAWDFDDLEEEFSEDLDSLDSEEDFDLEDIDGVSTSIAESLKEAGYDTKQKLATATIKDLTDVKGIGKKTAEKIIESAKE